MTMKDPLQLEGEAQALFVETIRRCQGLPNDLVYNIAINILVNAIRMTVSERSKAEQLIDDLYGRTKTLLLDFHYDPVTGKRRTLFPFTQRVEAPFHQSESKIF
jgi:hypothetical protein